MALIFDNVNNQIIDDHGNVIAPLDLNLVVRNTGGAPSLQEGLFSAMPAAGTAGRLYISTDTDQLLRDNGTSWDVIGAAGAGTVTSVGLTAPLQFAVSGSPITTFGTLNLAWNTQSANKIFAGPSSGTDALPTFRNLTVADLPAFTVPWANITSTPTTLGGYGITNAYSRVEIDAMTFNWSRITGTPTTLAGYGITDAKNGTVTSVSGSGGTTGLTLTGGPITDIGTLTLGGTLAIANGGTGATTKNAALNALLPTQTGSSGYVLTTDGSNSTWAPSTGGSGSGSPSAARFATTTTLPAYTASGSGVGKTLTGTATTALTIDGLTPAVNDRLLVKDEVSGNAPNNGVYVVTQQGTGASGTVEVTTVSIPFASAMGTTNDGKAIFFSSPTTDYYVWFNSSGGSGVDPAPAGRTRIGAGAMTYTSTLSDNSFASALSSFINTNASANFSATFTSAVSPNPAIVTITNVNAGPAKTAPGNDTATGKNPGFTFTVTTPGAASHPYILTRASDFISPKSGALVPVVLGNTNADTLWMLTTDGTITIDTTSLTFAKTNNLSGGAVTSFNTRTGAVTLSSADITSALTFTPYDAANPSGYITSSGTAANVSGTVALSHGGTGLSATGSANQLLGVTAAGSALEYKTLTSGTGLTVTNAANSITLNNTGVTSIVAGTGITISGATGAVTINSTGGSSSAETYAIVTAAGTTQSTATAISARLVFVTGGTALQGVILPLNPATSTVTTEITVVNQLSVAINVYPPSGQVIGGLSGGANVPLVLAAASQITFVSQTTGDWGSKDLPLVAGSNITITKTTGQYYTVAATGSVSSVQASGGTTGLSFSGGPVTTSGTLTLAGTLNVANGGTGATTLTGYVKGNGTSAMTASSTVPGTDVSGNIAGNAANVTGTVAVANGGTGATTLTGYVKGSGTSTMTASATIPTSDLTGNIDGGAF